MEILHTAATLQAYTETCRRAGQRIALVPTMGALHEGHLQLVRAAATACDVVIVSVFVNPTQFNNAEDFRLYPRLPEEDAALLEPAGCTVLFLPTVETMYPQPAVLHFDFGPLERVMEGAHRPGHFNGVATVVSKLFHLSRPHQAYFGQKDWQQVAVVRQLVADLSFDLELVSFPTVREADGLAMSSRNRRLSAAARAVAPRLHEALERAAQLVRQGTQSPAEVQQAAVEHIAAEPAFQLEYFEVADAHTLQPLAEWQPNRPVVLCLAAYLDGVRLIDNVVVK
ncbi:pantoate--beta-alanine ligase [Hymenobacter sp. BT186]|uniref:Pantothenate synthetase n=1 Tax=Hymenobacter telluris TaxID=2816474 RepID=A0A939F1L7_9BACT|nr:pantoate--beta-alanine ligase [Hymenobacter telluris]MBO0359768.1 pantoate--beta-alanine ligase [Hymenobacter telluris]MBW3375795.1 pantoate--beta-alanine ligase [Hymenobacter norwichensis]